MNIGTPLTECDFGDPSGLFSVNVDEVLGDEWGDIRDIEIITLKQHLYDKASEEAWMRTNDVDEVDIIANLLVTSKYSKAKEFVAIERNKFIIGIDAKKVDRRAIKYAFDLLSRIENLKDRGKIEFGEIIEVYETQSL